MPTNDNVNFNDRLYDRASWRFSNNRLCSWSPVNHDLGYRVHLFPTWFDGPRKHQRTKTTVFDCPIHDLGVHYVHHFHRLITDCVDWLVWSYLVRLVAPQARVFYSHRFTHLWSLPTLLKAFRVDVRLPTFVHWMLRLACWRWSEVVAEPRDSLYPSFLNVLFCYTELRLRRQTAHQTEIEVEVKCYLLKWLTCWNLNNWF